MRLVQVIFIGAGVMIVSCGYGKDTGPNTPKAQNQFEPVADRFVARTQSCFDNVFQVNLGRAITPEERGAQAKVAKAMTSLRAELLGCLTGKGYGNEVQLEPALVEGWLAKAGCQEFAQAAFKAPQCIALQSVVEEAGFSAEAASPPPRQPPAKKRPSGGN